MISNIPEFDINGSRLMAVPAVHYRSVFAMHVVSAFKKRSTRPKVIAVELGPVAVTNLKNWLKELGMVGKDKKLPNMLGLIHQNNRIHPRFKACAIALQQQYSKPLHEIPPSILNDKLNYSPISLICLSSVDSIIEAIRCAVEQDIPVYGIDIEETANTETPEFLIEDPLKAQENLAGYIKRNQISAMKTRDEYIDGRREMVMAARLKYLLKKYKRVLFTGGLAHWSEIQRLLSEPGLKPATQIREDQCAEYTRVLVHPAIAITQMDIFPNITTWYERQRYTWRNQNNSSISSDFLKLFHGQINAAYEAYFNDVTVKSELPEKQKILERWPAFLQLLENFCTVTHRNPLHLGSLLELAEAAIPAIFRKTLTDIFLKNDVEWALTENFPDLPVIVPAETDSDSRKNLSVKETMICVPEKDTGDGKKTKYHCSDSFLLAVPENEYKSTFISADWFMPEDFKSDLPEASFYNPWVWPPCEYFLHGTAFEAGNIVKLNKANKRTEIFEGSLLEGVDIKSTIRARVKGDKNIYINSKRKNMKEDLSITNGTSLDPTVFVFEEPSKKSNGHWELGAAGHLNLRDYVEDSELKKFDSKVNNFGSYFIGSVSIENSVSIPDRLQNVVAYMKELVGYVTFGNPCAHVKQSTEWLKATHYNTCPAIQNLSMSELLEFYKIHHNTIIKCDDWASTLVRIAIPYASARVIIVAPENYTPDLISCQEAQKKNIDLDIVPLTFFSDDKINRLRKRYSVYGGSDGLKYSKKVKDLLGPPDKYIEMLPARMQKQVYNNS